MPDRTVTCRECDRVVADSMDLCQACVDSFVAELLTVPGIVVDMTVTAARLDRMSNGRQGGKSAEVPLPIRISGKVGEDPDRDTYKNPWTHKASDDQLPTRRPYDALVNALTTWGRVFEDHYRVEIPIGARGLVQLVQTNRTTGRSNTARIERAVEDDYRVDRSALSITPTTAAEQIAVWLACHPDLIRMMPAAHEMFGELTDPEAGAITRARRAVDRLPELRFLGPCPTPAPLIAGEPRTCGAGLRAEKGETWVRCPRCRAQFEVVKIIADAKRRTEDRLWTLAQIGKYLVALDIHVPSSTLYDLDYHPKKAVPKRGWLHTDSQGLQTITTTWIHRNDPPVFRVGDVVRYFERHSAGVRVDGNFNLVQQSRLAEEMAEVLQRPGQVQEGHAERTAQWLPRLPSVGPMSGGSS